MLTKTFAAAASGDDGVISSFGPTYPPAGAPGVDTTSQEIQANKELFAGDQYVDMVAVRWDTSSLVDDTIVTQAQLQIHVVSKTDADGRNLVAEWYAGSNWPLDSADYTPTIATTALDQDITTITTGSVQTYTLSNPNSVVKNGYTGLRIGISGTGAAGQNLVSFAGFDHTTLQEPRLLLTYRIPNLAGLATLGVGR